MGVQADTGWMEGEQPGCPSLGGISCIQKGMDGRRAAWLPHLGWDQLYTEGEGWKESSLAALSWVGSAVPRRGGVEGEQPGCPVLGGISCTQNGEELMLRASWPSYLGWGQACNREGGRRGGGGGECRERIFPLSYFVGVGAWRGSVPIQKRSTANDEVKRYKERNLAALQSLIIKAINNKNNITPELRSCVKVEVDVLGSRP